MTRPAAPLGWPGPPRVGGAAGRSQMCSPTAPAPLLTLIRVAASAGSVSLPSTPRSAQVDSHPRRVPAAAAEERGDGDGEAAADHDDQGCGHADRLPRRGHRPRSAWRLISYDRARRWTVGARAGGGRDQEGHGPRRRWILRIREWVGELHGRSTPFRARAPTRCGRRSATTDAAAPPWPAAPGRSASKTAPRHSADDSSSTAHPRTEPPSASNSPHRRGTCGTRPSVRFRVATANEILAECDPRARPANPTRLRQTPRRNRNTMAVVTMRTIVPINSTTSVVGTS